MKNKFAILIAAIVGITTGLGCFTFSYAEGLSYFSSEPKACINCHIMNEDYDAWSKGSHHAAARCIDCHMPQSLIPKLIAKSDNGWRHSKAFTLQNAHEPLMITPRNSEILQNNCMRCHDQLTHDIAHADDGSQQTLSCVKCHSHVGHGARASNTERDK